MTDAEVLARVAEDDALLEVGRKAIEDRLIEWRDSRLSEMRSNGFVIREKDGKASPVVRFGPEFGLRIALRAIAAHVAVAPPPPGDEAEGAKP